MGDRPVAGKKLTKMHGMKQKHRGRKRGKERKKEGGQAGEKKEPHLGYVPFLTCAPTFLYSIYKPPAQLDAKHPLFSDFSAEDPPNFAAHR